MSPASMPGRSLMEHLRVCLPTTGTLLPGHTFGRQVNLEWIRPKLEDPIHVLSRPSLVAHGSRPELAPYGLTGRYGMPKKPRTGCRLGPPLGHRGMTSVTRASRPISLTSR